MDLTDKRREEIEATVAFHCADTLRVVVNNSGEIYEIRYAGDNDEGAQEFEIVLCHGTYINGEGDTDYELSLGMCPDVDDAMETIGFFGGAA